MMFNTVLYLTVVTLVVIAGKSSGDSSRDSSNDGSRSESNSVEQGPPDSTDELVCPIDWGLKCVRPLSEIAPKTGTAKQFCKGIEGGYIAEDRCHIRSRKIRQHVCVLKALGTLIDANECCRFG